MQREKRRSKSSKVKRHFKHGKKYVIDTNVILNNPEVINEIREKKSLVFCTTVLREIDGLKKGNNPKAKNMRDFVRFVHSNSDNLEIHHSEQYGGNSDNQIIKTAKHYQEQGFNTVLITGDILMSILAKGEGIDVNLLNVDERISDDIYRGFRDVKNIEHTSSEALNDLSPNEYVLKNDGLYRNGLDGIERLAKDKSVFGIKHRSVEQKCAIDALMDENIKLVTITGRAGTGKTLIAIAAALDQIMNGGKYEKLMVYRPTISMGQELGFLPGSIQEKIIPWMQPIFDNIEFLMKLRNPFSKEEDEWKQLEKEGILKIEALSFIRGRSIPNQFIIIDEAQNLTKHEVKTIISRAGEGTKIIMTGDVDQIDNPKLSATNNGLFHAIEQFRDQKIAAHVHLEKCERSELAKIASDIL